MFATVKTPCRPTLLRIVCRKPFMSTQAVHFPATSENDMRMLLILGKPGGGKGTIAKKILYVSFSIFMNRKNSTQAGVSHTAFLLSQI